MISKDDVTYIAALARFRLNEGEIDKFTKDLEHILDYINQLEKLDVTKVEPTSHVIPLTNVTRKDDIRPSLTPEEALSIAVEKTSGFFKVPKVIES